MTDKEKLYGLVKRVVANRKKNFLPSRISIGWPVFDHREIISALNTLLDLRISQGPRVREFEKQFAGFIGRKYAVAVNSGTSANTLAFATLIESGDLKRGDEVILPAATFGTVVSPILQLGLVPVYVDVDEKTLNIDPNEIKKAISKKTRAIMVVHSIGNPADINQIMRIARRFRLKVIEDCCEAHGSRVGGRLCGSFGDIVTFSFYVAHNMTTGEGGMALTNKRQYYDILTSLRQFGRLPLRLIQSKKFIYKDPVMGNYHKQYLFYRLGYNFCMADIPAALGIEQLKKLNSLNKIRAKNVGRYNKRLSKYANYLQLPETQPGTFHSFYGYPVILKKNAPFTRNNFAKFLESQNIENRPFFAGCLPDQPAFRAAPKRIVGKLPVSRWIRDNGFFIGCHPGLSKKQIEFVISVFNSYLAKY